MNSNEAFEVFADKFFKKYGYLPLGKDDPCRPKVEKVLVDLGSTFCELLEKEETINSTSTKQIDAISLLEKLSTALEDGVAIEPNSYNHKSINAVLAQQRSERDVILQYLEMAKGAIGGKGYITALQYINSAITRLIPEGKNKHVARKTGKDM